jgi:hypothetical protein
MPIRKIDIAVRRLTEAAPLARRRPLRSECPLPCAGRQEVIPKLGSYTVQGRVFTAWRNRGGPSTASDAATATRCRYAPPDNTNTSQKQPVQFMNTRPRGASFVCCCVPAQIALLIAICSASHGRNPLSMRIRRLLSRLMVRFSLRRDATVAGLAGKERTARDSISPCRMNFNGSRRVDRRELRDKSTHHGHRPFGPRMRTAPTPATTGRRRSPLAESASTTHEETRVISPVYVDERQHCCKELSSVPD